MFDGWYAPSKPPTWASAANAVRSIALLLHAALLIDWLKCMHSRRCMLHLVLVGGMYSCCHTPTSASFSCVRKT